MPTPKSTDKASPKPSAAKPGPKRAGSSRASGTTEAPSKPAAAPVGAENLKAGVSRFFNKSRELVASKAPAFADKAERAAHVAIDKTARGIDQFERGANDLEAKARKGLRNFLDKARDKV